MNKTRLIKILEEINEIVKDLERTKGIKIQVTTTDNGGFQLIKYTQSKIAPFEYSRCTTPLYFSTPTQTLNAVKAIAGYLVI